MKTTIHHRITCEIINCDPSDILGHRRKGRLSLTEDEQESFNQALAEDLVSAWRPSVIMAWRRARGSRWNMKDVVFSSYCRDLYANVNGTTIWRVTRL